jgi:hypothetical protein
MVMVEPSDIGEDGEDRYNSGEVQAERSDSIKRGVDCQPSGWTTYMEKLTTQ